MRFSSALLALASCTPIALAVALPVNTTQEFVLRSQVYGGQESWKNKFDGLYLQGYHSGAGTSMLSISIAIATDSY